VEVTSGTFVDPKALASDTLSKVLDQFEANYRSRGGTDFTSECPQAGAGIPRAQLINTYRRLRQSTVTWPIGGCSSVPTRVARFPRAACGKNACCVRNCPSMVQARGLVAANIMSDYTKPKAPSERNITVLSSEQETALAAKCSRDLWDVVEWALYSGMRFGEACSMFLARYRSRGGHRADRRNENWPSPYRAARLSARLGAILDRHPQRTDTNFLFHEPDGGLIDKDGLNRRLKAAMKAAKIQRERGRAGTFSGIPSSRGWRPRVDSRPSR